MSLQVNRFSGSIPSFLESVPDINVLEGKMFSCNNLNRKYLPFHDLQQESYQCGSDYTNISIYVSLIFMAFLLIVLVSYILIRSDLEARCDIF